MTTINEPLNQITCDSCKERYELPAREHEKMRARAVKVFIGRHGGEVCFREN